MFHKDLVAFDGAGSSLLGTDGSDGPQIEPPGAAVTGSGEGDSPTPLKDGEGLSEATECGKEVAGTLGLPFG